MLWLRTKRLAMMRINPIRFVIIEARPINQLPAEPVGNGNISVRPPVFAERYQSGAASIAPITSVSSTPLVKENKSVNRVSVGQGRSIVRPRRLEKPRRRAAVRSKHSSDWIRKVLQQ